MKKKYTTLLSVQAILVVCSISIFGTGCSKDVDLYEEVANTAIAAVQDPDNFCNYVGTHMVEMSGRKYLNCANEKISSLEQKINIERDNCDEIYRNYVGPPEKGYQLLKCDEEHGVNGMEIGIDLIEEFKNVGSGMSSCSNISALFNFLKAEWNSTRQFYIDLGLPEPYPEWSVFAVELGAAYKQNMTCKKVTKKFLGIEY